MMLKKSIWFSVLESPGSHFSLSFAANALQLTQTLLDDLFYLGVLNHCSNNKT